MVFTRGFVELRVGFTFFDRMAEETAIAAGKREGLIPIGCLCRINLLAARQPS